MLSTPEASVVRLMQELFRLFRVCIACTSFVHLFCPQLVTSVGVLWCDREEELEQLETTGRVYHYYPNDLREMV